MKPYSVDLKCPIGKGVNGIVYKGYWNDNIHLPLAVKKIPISAKARNEIYILKTLQNEASPMGTIPQLYHVEKMNGYYEVAMEYISGGTLSQYCAVAVGAGGAGGFSEKILYRILRDLLKSVALCHSKNILYGDMKLSNLIATQDIGKFNPYEQPLTTLIKTIDFGLSQYHNGAFFTKPFGTPTFMAPEIFHYHFSFPVDIWAIGICMYILSCGEYPFTNPSSAEAAMYNHPMDLRKYIMNTQVPTFSESGWSHYSKKFKYAIQDLLQFNPEDRPTAADMLNLNELL